MSLASISCADSSDFDSLNCESINDKALDPNACKCLGVLLDHIVSDVRVGTTRVFVTGVILIGDCSGLGIHDGLIELQSEWCGVADDCYLLEIDPDTVLTTGTNLALSINICIGNGVGAGGCIPASHPQHIQQDFFLLPGLVFCEGSLHLGT